MQGVVADTQAEHWLAVWSDHKSWDPSLIAEQAVYTHNQVIQPSTGFLTPSYINCV